MALKNIPVPPSRPKLDNKRFAAPALPSKAVTGTGLPRGAAPSVGVPQGTRPSVGIPGNASANPGVPSNATIGAPGMIAPPIMGGNQRVSRKSMKGVGLLGRNANLAHKKNFKDGSQDARDTDGLHTVTVSKGTMRSPAARAESKRQPVKRGKKVN
jgi:hypothetical protein